MHSEKKFSVVPSLNKKWLTNFKLSSDSFDSLTPLGSKEGNFREKTNSSFYRNFVVDLLRMLSEKEHSHKHNYNKIRFTNESKISRKKCQSCSINDQVKIYTLSPYPLLLTRLLMKMRTKCHLNGMQRKKVIHREKRFFMLTENYLKINMKFSSSRHSPY